MPKPITQQVIFDLTAKSTNIESLLKNIISSLQSGKFSESFSKGFVNSIQKVIDRSQELRKTLSSTDGINSKGAERLSASYNKLYSDINKIVSRIENNKLDFSDLVGYDKAEYNKLISQLENVKKVRDEIYSTKNITTKAAGKLSPGTSITPAFQAKATDPKVISNQEEINKLMSDQEAKLRNVPALAQQKLDIATKELQVYERMKILSNELQNADLRTTKGKALRAELQGYGVTGQSKAELKTDTDSKLALTTVDKLNAKVAKAQTVSASAIALLNTQLQELNSYKTQILAFATELGIDFNNAAGLIKTATTALETFENEAITAGQANMDKTQREMEDTAKAAGTLGKEAQNWSDTLQQSEQRDQFFGNLQSRITQIFGLVNAFQLLRRFVTASWEAIKELDAAFTKIAVVTDKTTSDLWNSFSTYNKMAQQLGVTTTDAIETSALYYQQGLETADVMVLTTETIKMAQIANMGFEEATKAMTAAIRGFKLEMQDANSVTDVYSSLAAEAAVDTQDLAVAISKVASIAGNAGLSFENTSAFLTQIIETTQEAAETAGTALKTIIARFSELTKDPTSLTVEVEGEVVDANKIEAALRLAKVDLRDTEGQFRDLDTVFLELSKSWDSLDRNTQRYIATTAAGSRQQSRFIAMMDDYKRTQELVAIANDSAGASEIQFAKTLDSVDAKVKKLKSSFEALIGRLVENKTVKGFLDLLNKGLQFLVSVSEKGLGTFVLFITTIALLIKKMLKTSVGIFQKIVKQWEIHRAEISKDILLKLHLDTTEAEAKLKFLKAQAEALRTGAPMPTYTPPTQTAPTTNSNDFIGSTPLQTNKEINKAVLGTLKADMAKTVASGMATGLILGVSSGDWKTGLTTGLLSVLFSVLSNPALLKGIGKFVIGGVKGVGGTAIAASLKGIVASAGAALSAAAIPIIIGAAAIAIGVALYKIFDPLERAKRAVKKAEEDLAKAQESAEKSKASYLTEKDNLKTVADSISKYNELNNKINITADEQIELNDVTNKLAEQFPQILQYYDEAGNAVIEQGIQWKEILKTQKEIALSSQQQYAADLVNLAKAQEQTRVAKLDEAKINITRAKNAFKEYTTGPGGTTAAFKESGYNLEKFGQALRDYGYKEEYVKEKEAEMSHILALEAEYKKLEKQATLTGQTITNAFKVSAQTYLELYNLTAEKSIDKNLYGSIQEVVGEQLQAANLDLNTDEGKQAAYKIANDFISTLQTEINNTEINTDEAAKKMANSTEKDFISYLETLKITPTGTPDLYATLMVQFQTEADSRQGILDKISGLSSGGLMGVDPATVDAWKAQIEEAYIETFGSEGLQSVVETYGTETGAIYLKGLMDKVSSGELTEGMAQALSKIDISTVPGAQSGYNALLALGIDKDSAEQAILELAKSIGKSDIVNKNTLLNTSALAESLNNMTKAANKGAKAAYKLSEGYILEEDEIKELLELYPDLQKELGDYTNKKEDADTVLAEALGKATARETAANFYKILEENLTILKTAKKGTTDYEEALIRVRNLLNNPDWEVGADNLSLLERAANGDLTAINTLKEAIRDQLVLSVVGRSDFNKLNTDLLTVATLGQKAFNELSKIAGFKTVRKMIFPGVMGAPAIYADVLEYTPTDTDFYSPPPSGGGGGGGKESEYETKVNPYYNEIQAIENLNNTLDDLAEKREAGNLSPKDYQTNIQATTKYYKELQDKLHQYNEMLRADQAKLADDINKSGYGDALKVVNGQLITNRDLILGFSPKIQQAIDDQIDKYNEYSDTIYENSEAWRTAQEAQLELLNESREAYVDLEQKIIDILIKQDQDEIDATQKKYDALKKADSDYLDALRKNISDRRKARDKEESYSDLAKKEKRLALLKRDTSGIYAAEILSLEEEIAQQRQDLADQETDDMVTNLEDQAQTRAEAYDEELEELNNLQKDKEKSMEYYNQRANEIMAQGYDQLMGWFMQNDTEFLTATETAQQKYIESWKNTVNEASMLSDLTGATGGQTAAQTYAQAQAAPKYSRLAGITSLNPTASGGDTYASAAKQIQERNAVQAMAWYQQHVAPRIGMTGPDGIDPEAIQLIQEIIKLKYQYEGIDFTGFSAGGLADFTGLAMVHGSTTDPEAFLSASDTRNFQTLAQLLSSAISYNGTSGETPESGATTVMGDINITIEVAELSDDYDVEQMVEKVKQEIVNSSNYRNVNLISKVR